MAPEKERPKDGIDASLSEETGGDRKQKEREQEIEEALQFIVKSGRAQTMEEAAEYLRSINSLQKTLLGVAREIATRQQIQRNPEPYPHADPVVLYGERLARESDMKLLTVPNLDGIYPHVWRLKRFVEPAFPVMHAEHLVVPTRPGPHMEIVPDVDGRVWAKLKEHLSEEELELLRREYQFELKDLVKTLREAAESIERQKDFRVSGLEKLFSERKKAE